MRFLVRRRFRFRIMKCSVTLQCLSELVERLRLSGRQIAWMSRKSSSIGAPENTLQRRIIENVVLGGCTEHVSLTSLRKAASARDGR